MNPGALCAVVTCAAMAAAVNAYISTTHGHMSTRTHGANEA